MLIEKRIEGTVVQLFDTETGKYTMQYFQAGDQVEYRDEETQKPVKPIKPYLSFDMKQPDDIEDPFVLPRPDIG